MTDLTDAQKKDLEAAMKKGMGSNTIQEMKDKMQKDSM